MTTLEVNNRAIDIMEEVADWLEMIQPEGKVTLHGFDGDYRMLVGELRIAIEDLRYNG